jgi:hypothetical protein
MRLHQNTSLVFASLLFAIAAPALSQAHELELNMQCLRSDDAVALRVTLRNVGSTDTAVVLGTSIGNGQRYVADSLVLEFKRSQGDDAEGFRPTLGAIAGRVDPWIVTIPAVSEFSFERPEEYFFSSRGEPLKIGSGGLIRLRLIRGRFAGELVGAALVKVSTDQLQTEWVRVPGECHVG